MGRLLSCVIDSYKKENARFKLTSNLKQQRIYLMSLRACISYIQEADRAKKKSLVVNNAELLNRKTLV